MIRWQNVLRLVGFFVLALTGSLALTTLVALFLATSDLSSLVSATLTAGGLGGFLVFAFRSAPREISHREGILLVLITWVIFSVLGALPFYFSGYFASFTDAFFESISGFTTTGATILEYIEAAPRGLLERPLGQRLRLTLGAEGVWPIGAQAGSAAGQGACAHE